MNLVVRQKSLPSGQEIQIVQGDITQEPVEAIVNAANDRLQHGGGLAGVIVRRGGWQIQTESTAWVRKYGLVSHERPAYTSAGSLSFRYVIHAVGPVWSSSDEAAISPADAKLAADAKLTAAMTGALKLADELELASLALPAISTGIFGFPKARAAGLILTAVEDYFAAYPESQLKLVRVTLFDQPTVDVFLRVWDDEWADRETGLQSVT